METFRVPLKELIGLELDQLRQDATFVTLYTMRKAGVPKEAIQTGLSVTGNLEWVRRR